MNATHPQWKPLPDSPGIWVLERESELAALLGAKYAILDIKQCSLDRPTSRKYCIRAYGPIPTETAAAQIIHTAEPIQFSTHDRQQLQIEQLIRDVKELHQKSLSGDFAYSAAISALEERFTQEKEARKLLEAQHKEQISLLRKEINELAEEIDQERTAREGLENALNRHADLIDKLHIDVKDCDTNRIANVEDLQSQIQAGNAIIEQHTEQIRALEENDKEENRTAAALSTRISTLQRDIDDSIPADFDLRVTILEKTTNSLQRNIEQEQTRIANDRAQVEFTATLSARLDMHAKDLAELTNDAKEADKKILANAGAIARIIRHLERLPERQEQPAPDIADPTATAWNTEKQWKLNAEILKPPTAEVNTEDIW